MMKTPDSKAAISKVLAERGLSPLHRFGQNFLIRKEALERIVAAAEIHSMDVVLEVGPGLGGLTERLLMAEARVVASEIDHGLAEWIESTLGSYENLWVVEGDVMAKKSQLAPGVLSAVEAVLPNSTQAEGSGSAVWKVVANLPYQISSPFLSALALLPTPPSRIVVTVQKEVGDVLLSKPGDSDWSPLAFLMSLGYTAERVMNLPPDNFYPQPQVKSVVMRLLQGPARPIEPARWIGLARMLFQGRRKALRRTLPRALSALLPGAETRALELMRAVDLDPMTRIQTIPPEQLERLAILALKEV